MINLILPFEGKWTVRNGGKELASNNHLIEGRPKNQGLAYDFAINRDESNNLSDYPSYGKNVIAPCDGKVIQVISGAHDVAIGERDRSVGVGNAVMIQIDTSTYAFLCHMMYESITVNVGQEIKRGDLIGKCGNSGNSSQPHIHFHLQDSPEIYKGNPILPIFSKIKVNGIILENAQAKRFDEVENI
ncbi:MAG: M23 family metallopeptidase [Patescibacteria group bacterium]